MDRPGQVRHILRRFGLGAGQKDRAAAGDVPWQKALDLLLSADQRPESFPVDYAEFIYLPDGNQSQDPSRAQLLYLFRLLATNRPASEKAALFWIDHFAISAGKVEHGPMMHDYIERVRAGALGRYPDLLVAISESAAMIHWLDGNGSIKGKPNENFAREVLELYTLGIGHYSEDDVRELARACTGWSLRYPQYENGGTNEKLFVDDSLKFNREFVAASFAPGLFDEGEKTIVGKTARFDMASALKDLAMRPQTARHLAKKLIEWYAFQAPSDAEIGAVSKAYLASGGSMKACLHAIAKLPAFWDENRCPRHQIKNPVEYGIGLARSLSIGDAMVARRFEERKRKEAMPDEIAGPLYWLSSFLERMDMMPFYPPDVGGWEWGPAWINSNTITYRQKFREFLVYAGIKDQRFCHPFVESFRSNPPTTVEAIADRLLDGVDAELASEQKALLVEVLSKAGGLNALQKSDSALHLVDQGLRAILATPEISLH
ncbi:MAG: hypothetical protein HONBIEJF_00133 [Fimbriimonadaceae bacterium]|nr:hypothetical protein [Fimbriimonadaceae bacterium]